MRTGKKPADQRGVALLEVLIALVIVSFVIASFASIATVSFVSASDGRDKMLANWIALNDITELRLQPAPPSVGRSSDTVDFAGLTWRVEREVEETPVENIRRVDVDVMRDNGTDSEDDLAIVQLSGFIGPRAPAQIALPEWAAYTPVGESGNNQTGRRRPGERSQ